MANQTLTIRPFTVTTVPGTTLPQPFNAGNWTNIGGAANLGAALQDNSDSTVARLPAGTNYFTAPNTYLDGLYFDGSGISLPAGSQIRGMQGRLRWRWNGDGQQPGANVKCGIQQLQNNSGLDLSYSFDIDNPLPPITNFATQSFTEFFPVVSASLSSGYLFFISVTAHNYGQNPDLTMDGTIEIAAAYFDIIYNAPPTVTPITFWTSDGSTQFFAVSNTTTPEVRWTYADPELDAQERYKVAIWKSSDVTALGGGFTDPYNTVGGGSGNAAYNAVYATGEVFSNVSHFNVPAGYLKSGETYKVYVTAADAGSNGRYSTASGALDFGTIRINIEPSLMPTLCLLPSAAANVATAPTNGGVSFSPTTGQIDGLVVGGRANLFNQLDASFETPGTGVGNIGGWTLSGGGSSAGSTAFPFFGTGHLRTTADGTGTGHVILTSQKVSFGDPGLVALNGHPLYTFMVHVRPVVSVATGELVTLTARFYDASNVLLTDQPQTSQHLNSSGGGVNSYKKLWLICHVPVGAVKCDVVLNIGPCGSGKQYDIDAASITPWAFNLLDNSSYEVQNPTMWTAAAANTNTVTFGVAEQASEYAGGQYCIEIVGNSAGNAYVRPTDAQGAANNLSVAIEGGVSLAMSASAKTISGGPNAVIDVNDTVGGNLAAVSLGSATTWQRYGGSTGVLSPTASHDYFILVGSGSANSPNFDIRIDDVQVEPVFQFVNGNMDSAPGSGIQIPLTCSLNGNAQLGWVQDSAIADASVTTAYWTNTKSQSGSFSISMDVAANSINTTQISQYFSVAGRGAIQGQFVAQWLNCAWWSATLQQFDNGGNMVQTDALYFNAGTSNTVWTPVSFAVAANTQAAYAKIIFSVNGAFLGSVRPDVTSISRVWIDSVAITVPSAQVYGTTMYSGPTSAAFGSLINYSALPTGQPFVPTTTPSYSLGAGTSIWFAGLLSDNRVLFGTQPQTINPLLPTADHCELDIFDPAANTWSQIIVPTSNHSTTAVIPGAVVGGNEIADVAISGSSAFWLSSGIVFNWNTATSGVYPVLGVLTKTGTIWSINRSYRAEDIRASNPGADTATLWPQVTDNYGNSYYDSCGAAEMAFTSGPAAGYLVITHYFPTPGSGTAVLPYPTVHSGGISIVDPTTGLLKATYRVPDMVHANGKLLTMAPRGVECDPTSATSTDIRFVVIYDAYFRDGSGSAGHPIQEFSLDATTFTITPKSVPIIPDPNGVVTGSGVMVADPNVIAYGPGGDLYVACNNLGATGIAGLNSPGTAVFKRSGTPIPCLPGGTYAMTASYLAGTTGRVIRLNIRFIDSGQNIISTVSNGTGTSDNNASWTTVSFSAVAPANAAFVTVLVEVDSTGGAGEIHWVDNIQLTLNGGPNLLSSLNSSFEGGIGDWNPSGSGCTCASATPPVAAPAGTKAMSMTSTGAGSITDALFNTPNTLEQLAGVAAFPNWATDRHVYFPVTPTFFISNGRTTYVLGLTTDATNLRVYESGANGILSAITWTSGLNLGSNLLSAAQAGFETFSGWAALAGSSTIAQSSTVAHTGTFSMKMTSTSSSKMAATTPTGTSGFAVTQGQQYQATAWFRADVTATPVKCYIVPYFYDSAGNFISNNTNSVVQASYTKSIIGSTSAWTQTYTTFDPPLNASFVAISVVAESTVIGQIYYVDDAVLQTLPYSIATADLLFNPLRNSVPANYSINTFKPAVDVTNNRLWIPLTQSLTNTSGYSTHTTPAAVPQWIYKVAITAGASPTAQANGPTPWIDGGWSGGGLVGSFVGIPTLGPLALQRSTDKSTWTSVRGVQGIYPKTATKGAFGPTFKWTWDDYEWPSSFIDGATQSFYYRSYMTVSPTGRDVVTAPVGRDYTITPTAPLATTEWLLIDPLTSTNNYTLHLKTFKAEKEEVQTAFTPLGRTRKVVVGDVVLGDHITLTLLTWTNQDWVSIQKVINQQSTLLLRSPDGEMWYVRPIKRSRERVWTGEYKPTAFRTLTVEFEEVDVLT